MYKIYLIRDIHGLKYVGITQRTIKLRLKEHESDKRNGRYCSSHKLDFTCCKISILEDNITEENKNKKENDWINKINCVNEKNVISDIKQHKKEYFKNHYEKHKEEKKQYQKKYDDYQKGWGGDKRYYNCLLLIDVDLFK